MGMVTNMKSIIWLSDHFPTFRNFSIEIITLSIANYLSGELARDCVSVAHQLRGFICSLHRVRACCEAWVWNMACFHRCEEFHTDLGIPNLSLVGIRGSAGRNWKESFFSGSSIWSSCSSIVSHTVPWYL